MKKVIVFFAVLFILTAFAVQNLSAVFVPVLKTQEDKKVNTEIFKSFSAYKTADVEKIIRDAEKKRQESSSEDFLQNKIKDTLKKLETGKISLKKVFSDTCFVGDSLLNGLEVYNILNADRLITQVSARFDHLEESIEKITDSNPEILVLHYGLNMLWPDETGTKWFIDDYSELVLKLKKKLPYTRIIISSIFPVDKEIADDEIFTHIPRHNAALEKMCKDIGVEFLDSTDLVESNSDHYAPDGIHLNASFYTEKWLPYIVESKGVVV